MSGEVPLPENLCLCLNYLTAFILSFFRVLRGGLPLSAEDAKVGTFAYVPKAGAFGYVRFATEMAPHQVLIPG